MNNYEAEVVEDIPEQFDLSRYKKRQITPPTTQASVGYNRNSAPHHHLYNVNPQKPVNFVYPPSYDSLNLAFANNFHMPRPYIHGYNIPPQVYYPKNDFDPYVQKYDEKYRSTTNGDTTVKVEGRKKNSFGDEENENPYQKKEYFLKGMFFK